MVFWPKAPLLTAREEPTAPIAAARAATKNIEQKMRRNRDGLVFTQNYDLEQSSATVADPLQRQRTGYIRERIVSQPSHTVIGDFRECIW
jgi:hypothetical protein